MRSSHKFLLMSLILTLVFVIPALAQDSDGDGLSDQDEISVWLTDPYDDDSDDDGQLDGVEAGGATSPVDADSDDDGLSDFEETIFGTDAADPDSDGDGLSDGLEMGRTTLIPGGTSDGWSPGDRVTYLGTAASFVPDSDSGSRTDPRDADTDNDGLIDAQEDRDGDGYRDLLETNPVDADTDDDGLADGEEDINGSGSLDIPDETDPLDFDMDGDGLGDGLESGVTAPISGGTSDGPNPDVRVTYMGTGGAFVADGDASSVTDPKDSDTDNDGLGDGQEDLDGNGRLDPSETDPVDADTDNDGISDDEEPIYNLDNTIFDSDGDGLGDGLEIGRTAGIPDGFSSGMSIYYGGTGTGFTPDSDPASRTDPLDSDSDNDGIPDGGEDVSGNGQFDPGELDPVDADTDDDGLADGEEPPMLLNGTLFDTDGDGLGDGLELGRTVPVAGGMSSGSYMPHRVDYTGTGMSFIPDADPSSTTDPKKTDTDSDMIPDGVEDQNRNGLFDPGELDPGNPDTDGDALNDGVEFYDLGTNPLDPDSDGDGLDDYEETDGGLPIDTDGDAQIDAWDLDSDNDGYLDSDPLEGLGDDDMDTIPNYRDPDSPSIDTDGDGLCDDLELTLGTDPLLVDSDADGIGDFVETDGGQPVDTDGDGQIDALDPDSDGDNVPDQTEGVVDTDGDGVPDYRDADDDGDGLPTEIEGIGDPDGDGLPNYLDWDSDDDTFSDAVEDQAGSDPYDPASTPLTIHNPVIAAIGDVGNDQGRRVRIGWSPSDLDTPDSPTPIFSYSIYRRIDEAKAGGEACVSHAKVPGLWDFVMNLPATGEAEYNTLAETLCDSTEAGVRWSVFFVRAHTQTPTEFYDSAPDSGYSIDNLAPAAPAGFLVAYGDGNTLSWDPSEDEDFQYFKIYRADGPDFVPDEGTLIHATADTGWIDEAGGFDAHYLISAVDVSGNESPATAPSELADAAPPTIPDYALHRNVPNPFNPSTTLSFSLPSSGDVRLSIYDLTGRLVVRLLDEPMSAGVKSLRWAGRDGDGGPVASGVYVLRLETSWGVRSQKLMLAK